MRCTHKKKNPWWLFLLVAVMILTACSSPAETAEETETQLGEPVASVNGEIIYQQTFQKVADRMIWSYEQQGMDFEGEEGEILRADVQESVLEHLIQQAVMMQEAKRQELVVTDEAVNAEYESLKNQFDSEEAFQDILERTMFTEAELKETLKTEMTIEALLGKAVEAVEVAEEEILELYAHFESQAASQREAMEADGTELTEDDLAMLQLPPYEEMRDNIHRQLLQEKQQQAMMTFVDRLMEQSEIEKFI